MTKTSKTVCFPLKIFLLKVTLPSCFCVFFHLICSFSFEFFCSSLLEFLGPLLGFVELARIWNCCSCDWYSVRPFMLDINLHPLLGAAAVGVFWSQWVCYNRCSIPDFFTVEHAYECWWHSTHSSVSFWFFFSLFSWVEFLIFMFAVMLSDLTYV